MEADKYSAELKQLPRGLVILIVVVLFGAMLYFLHYIQDVFTPLFLALTLVLTVRPLARKLQAIHVPGWFAASVTFLSLVVFFGGFVSIMVWAFTPVPQTLVNYSGNFEQAYTGILDLLQAKGVQTEDIAAYVEQLNIFNSMVSWAWTAIDSLRSIGGLLAIVIIALLFIVVDTTTLNVRSAVIDNGHAHIGHALAGFEKRVRHYWIISTIFGLIVAVIDVFALGALGVPLALTWGVWAFVTNYIPNIGFVLGVIPPMLMGLADSGWQTMVWVAVLYTVINVVIQTFIQPKFTGDVVGLSPTVTFISLVLWTSVVGWLGSILAVPLTLFFKAVLVDSDSRTQWLDVFLVSEKDTARRRAAGLYDGDHPELVDDLEFRYPTDSLAKIPIPKIKPSDLPAVVRQHRSLRRRATKNQEQRREHARDSRGEEKGDVRGQA